MTDMILTGASLVALLGWPLVALLDVLRHPVTPQGPQPDRGAMTAQGVPYVRGVDSL